MGIISFCSQWAIFMCLNLAGGKRISSPSNSSILPGSSGTRSNSSNVRSVVVPMTFIILSPASGASEQPVEELARALADLAQGDVEALLVEMLGCPALHQIREGFELRLRSRQAAFRMTGDNALAVIDGAIEGGRIAQEIGIFPLQVAHLLDHVDARRRVQHFVKNPGAFEPQIHQGEIDIVIAAQAGLERVARPLLTLQTGAHFGQFFARSHALAVAPPVDFL